MAPRKMSRNVTVAEAFGSVEQYVNLIGVIVYYKPPTKSRGSDYHCLVRIIDPSHHSDGLAVSIFSLSEENLPQVECEGDIIVVRRVKIQNHENKTYALFHKEKSSFALYEGTYVQSFDPYQASSNFRIKNEEQRKVDELRNWMDIAKLDIELKKFISLSEIRKEEKLHLVCKVLHMSEINQDELMLFVWDGTDAPPCTIDEKLDDEKKCPLPLQLEGERLWRTIVSKFPCAGTVLRIKVDRRRGCLDPTSSVGQWAMFINLAIDVHAGLWCGNFSQSTRIRHVPDEDRHVLQCLSNFEKRDRLPITSCPRLPDITETENNDAALVTLMDIINYSKVTATFRCVVRVVSMLPFNPEGFFDSEGKYKIRLTLEDPTARIHAYLFDTGAEMFFGGKPGTDDLARKRNKFLGIAGSSESEDAPGSRNPPWMVLGIASHYRDKAKPWETRAFAIVQTKLLA